MRIDSSGNVGIGTTSPSVPLEIESGNPRIRLTDSGGGYTEFGSNNTDLVIRVDPDDVVAGSTMQFEVDGSEHMRIATNGNIGIGTTSPSGKLEVSNGTHSLVINPHSAGMDLHSSGNFAPHYQTSFDWFTGALGSGTFRMRLDSSGNLGIGTTSPSRKLDVVGGFFRTSDAASGKESAFVQGGTGYAYFGNLGSGPAAFGNSENYTTLIANGGNIAIGTTSLSGTNRLEIESINPYDLSTGGNDTGGILIRGAVSTGNGSYTGGIGFGFGTGTVGLAGVQESADSDYLGMAFFTHPTGTGNAASEEKMRISASGNVGIGTTSPSDKMHIYSAGNGKGLTIEATSGNYESAVLKLYPKSPTSNERNWAISAYRDAADDLSFSSSNAKGGDPYSSGTTRMLIEGITGNVGIGTTSPSVKLHVEANSNVARFTSSINSVPVSFYTTGNSVSTIGFKGSTSTNDYNVRCGADANDYVIYTNNAEKFRINSSGNVGIGTTSPSYKLDVSASGVGGIRSVTSVSGWAGWFENTNNSSGVVVTAGVDSGDAPLLIRKQDGTELFSVRGNGTSWFQNGNVGIGTTSPSEKLDVNGNIANSGDSRGIYWTGGTTNSQNRIVIGEQDSYGVGFRWDSGQRLQFDGFWNTSVKGSANRSLGSIDVGNRWWTFENRVGIGTDSPSENLHISGGALRIDNSVGNRAFITLNENANDDNIVLEYDGTGSGDGNYFSIYSGNSSWVGKGDGFNYVPSTGYVGIGTSTPSTQLELFGSSQQEIKITLDAATDHSLRLQQTGSGTYIGGQDSSGNVNFAFRAYNYSHFSNNLGLGITVPAQHISGTERVLHIANSNVASVNLDSTGGSGRCYVVSSTASGNFSVYDDDANSTPFTINSSGNVGIGTTSPYVNLTVKDADSQTTTGLSEALRIAATAQAVGNKKEIGFSPYDSGAYPHITLGMVYTSTASYCQSDFYITTRGTTTNSAPTERFRITGGGNVGIGCTDPQTNLEIRGAAPFLTITNTTEDEAGIYFNDYQAGANPATSSQAAAIKFQSGSGNALTFYNNDANAARMEIDSSGNVACYNNLNVTNTVTANAFSGDGSALTGITTGAISSLSIDKIYSLASMGASGYMKLVDGLLIQWGSFYSNTDAAQTVSFPTTFTTVYTVYTSLAASTITRTTSSFTVDRLNDLSNSTHYFVAIGYTSIVTV
jgi:hypothetical protein